MVSEGVGGIIILITLWFYGYEYSDNILKAYRTSDLWNLGLNVNEVIIIIIIIIIITENNNNNNNNNKNHFIQQLSNIQYDYNTCGHCSVNIIFISLINFTETGLSLFVTKEEMVEMSI